MNLLEQCNQCELTLANCHCSACTFVPKTTIQNKNSDLHKPNQMHTLLKMLPPGFPIVIEQTITLERNQDGTTEFLSYHNPSKDDKIKWILNKQPLRSLHSLSSQNLQLYFNNRGKIISKYEAANLFSNPKADKIETEEIIYIQPYQPRPIVRTTYHHEENQFDSILKEYLEKEQDKFRSNNYHVNEETLEWVHREYGEDTFCQFLAELYVKFFKAATNHTILSAIFFWALQPHQNHYSVSKNNSSQYNQLQMLGRPRRLPFKPKLLNLKQLQIHFYQKIYSFQQQYNTIIKQKIHNSSKTTISAIKNKTYRLRLEQFRLKLKNTFQEEQQHILSKVQEEKPFQFQQDSENMAQLLIPNLAPYKTLKEVINDQTAFRKVFPNDVKNDPRIKRIKTQYKSPKTQINKYLLTPLKQKQSKTKAKESIKNYDLSSVVQRHKLLLKTPSTHQ